MTKSCIYCKSKNVATFDAETKYSHFYFENDRIKIDVDHGCVFGDASIEFEICFDCGRAQGYKDFISKKAPPCWNISKNIKIALEESKLKNGNSVCDDCPQFVECRFNYHVNDPLAIQKQ